MPRAGLLLDVVFLLLALGWRSWLQYRRTGDVGLRRPSRSATPIEKVAGALLLAGALGLLVSPVLVLAGLAAPLRAFQRLDVQVLGLLLACCGIGLTVLAELQMGESWRVGVDPSEVTSLVGRGLFRYTRNPIYSGMLLFALGLFCVVPTTGTAAAVLVLTVAIQIQVRGVEEPYLLRRHGQAYRDYARTAGRFVPWIGRLA